MGDRNDGNYCRNELRPNKHNETKQISENKLTMGHNKIFQSWSFGTINIRSGKEKDEGGKIYLVSKEVARI